jgi:hypothetical protein
MICTDEQAIPQLMLEPRNSVTSADSQILVRIEMTLQIQAPSHG